MTATGDRERLEAKASGYAELANRMRALRESEEFAALRASMAEAKKKVMDATTRALMRGEPANQRQIDYDRGYWDGVAQVLEAPWSALQAYERTMERLERSGRRTEG